MKVLAGLVGALAIASTAQAATYDAFASFDGTQGAGGFTYLMMPAGPGGTPQALSQNTGCVVSSDFCLQAGSGLPGVYKSLEVISEGTYTVPDDRFLVHPGVVNPVAIFFTAPKDGIYDYIMEFNVLDRSPSGVGLVSVTNASGVGVGTPIGALGAGNLSLTKTGSISLAQGQILGLIVNPAGSYSNDSTGVSFRLTTTDVPEPGAWALMILGFGGAGGMLRRARRRAFA